jgi:hypothetical protein
MQYNLWSMLILRFICENSTRIIVASSTDPAVLKTGSQALVCLFLPNLYTNFTILSNTPLICQCALICTHSYCILDQGRVFWSPIRTFKMCIASHILVTGSVNGSQNVYCVSDYCQRLWHMYSSIRSESRRPDVKWHLYILPGDFLCGSKLIAQY